MAQALTRKFKKRGQVKMSTTNTEQGSYTVRKYLCGERSPANKKFIDMEYVYKELSKGRTRYDVADELGVHINTLYNHHKKYQAQLQVLLKAQEKKKGGNFLNEDLPPLPDEY